MKSDRDDLSEYAKTLTEGFPRAAARMDAQAPRLEVGPCSRTWRALAFVDHQVGRVLDALDKSPHAKNTIVVLLSDHGWHLGEKERWAKRSLWNDGTRVPLIVAAPGYTGNQKSDRPVGLIDIFPTLLSLSGLPARKDLEGRDLKPLLKKPDAKWDRPILTSFSPHNHSLRATRWHYIRYADGSEELYDHQSDPHEWRNLAGETKHAKVIAELRGRLPKHNAKAVLAKNPPSEVKAWRKAEAYRLRHQKK